MRYRTKKRKIYDKGGPFDPPRRGLVPLESVLEQGFHTTEQSSTRTPSLLHPDPEYKGHVNSALEALALPQKAMMKSLTGEYTTPSEYTNTPGVRGFALDMIADPINLTGIGAGVRALSKTPTAIRHVSGIMSGVRDISKGRPVFETFPITKAQRARVSRAQDIEVEKALQFHNDWVYDPSGNVRPGITSRMKGFSSDIFASVEPEDVVRTLNRIPNVTTTTGSRGLRELRNKNIVSPEDIAAVKRTRHSAFGINTGDASITYRNSGLYYHRPRKVGDTALHEAAHSLQKTRVWAPSEAAISDPFSFARPWMEHAAAPGLGYYVPNPYTAIGNRLSQVMHTPGPNASSYSVWRGAPGELHSELMPARRRLVEEMQARGISRERAIQYIQEPTTISGIKLVDHGKLRRFFKPSTTQEQIREILKIMPAAGGAGFIGSEVLSSEGKPKQQYKTGGSMKVKGYSRGGAIGSGVGTGVGAAVGSVIPGVGNAVGATVGGALGGVIGNLVGGSPSEPKVPPAAGITHPHSYGFREGGSMKIRGRHHEAGGVSMEAFGRPDVEVERDEEVTFDAMGELDYVFSNMNMKGKSKTFAEEFARLKDKGDLAGIRHLKMKQEEQMGRKINTTMDSSVKRANYAKYGGALKGTPSPYDPRKVSLKYGGSTKKLALGGTVDPIRSRGFSPDPASSLHVALPGLPSLDTPSPVSTVPTAPAKPKVPVGTPQPDILEPNDFNILGENPIQRRSLGLSSAPNPPALRTVNYGRAEASTAPVTEAVPEAPAGSGRNIGRTIADIAPYAADLLNMGLAMGTKKPRAPRAISPTRMDSRISTTQDEAMLTDQARAILANPNSTANERLAATAGLHRATGQVRSEANQRTDQIERYNAEIANRMKMFDAQRSDRHQEVSAAFKGQRLSAISQGAATIAGRLSHRAQEGRMRELEPMRLAAVTSHLPTDSKIEYLTGLRDALPEGHKYRDIYNAMLDNLSKNKNSDFFLSSNDVEEESVGPQAPDSVGPSPIPGISPTPRRRSQPSTPSPEAPGKPRVRNLPPASEILTPNDLDIQDFPIDSTPLSTPSPKTPKESGLPKPAKPRVSTRQPRDPSLPDPTIDDSVESPDFDGRLEKPEAPKAEEAPALSAVDTVNDALFSNEGIGDDVTDILTGWGGLTDQLRKDLGIPDDASDEEAARTAVEHFHSQLSSGVENYDSSPHSMQVFALDTNYNTGKVQTFPKFRAAMRDGDWQRASTELLDTANVDGQSVRGIAERRARHFNKVAKEVGFPKITRVKQDRDGTITYFAGNDVVKSYTPRNGRHPKSNPIIATL